MTKGNDGIGTVYGATIEVSLVGHRSESALPAAAATISVLQAPGAWLGLADAFRWAEAGLGFAAK